MLQDTATSNPAFNVMKLNYSAAPFQGTDEAQWLVPTINIFLRSHADDEPVKGKAVVVTSTWIEREEALRQKVVSKK